MPALHVVMPWTRWHHLDLYLDELKPCNVIWNPLYSKGEWAKKVKEVDQTMLPGGGDRDKPRFIMEETWHWCTHCRTFPDLDWIKPHVTEQEPGPYELGKVMPAWWRINRFIEMLCVEAPKFDDDWFYFCADDCLWNPGFFRIIGEYLRERSNPDSALTKKVCGPERMKAAAQGADPGPFPASALMVTQCRRDALLNPMSQPKKSFACDISMIVLKGDRLRQFRLKERVWYADTLWIEEMAEAGVFFEPLCDGTGYPAISYYNALDPASWGFRLGGKQP